MKLIIGGLAAFGAAVVAGFAHCALARFRATSEHHVKEDTP